MRRTTAFLSLALFVGTLAFAACSDRQPASPTAPAAGAAGITASQNVSTAPAAAAGKPTPGFTQIIEVSAMWCSSRPVGLAARSPIAHSVRPLSAVATTSRATMS
jgi:hypothetical protein